MIYRPFGKTGINMPVLSLGCMRSMYKWQDICLPKIPPESQKNLSAIVHRAMALGINHFETARWYGSSERQLGEVLQELPREKIILQTKIAPQADPADFVNQFNDSLSRLQVETVDLLAIHGINDHRALWHTCRANGCLAAARALQARGRVGHVGFSSHGTSRLLLETLGAQENNGFDYINLHWYFINQLHWPVIREAERQGIGVFIISPTDKGGMLQTPSETTKCLCSPLSPMLFNDLFCLTHPQVSTISVGATKPSDFDEHLKVLPLLTQDTGTLPAILTNLAQAMEEATGHGDPTWLWPHLPSWEQTPGYINIPLILWLFNLQRGWGLEAFAQRRYRQLGQDMLWVPGNNARHLTDYDLTEILRNGPLPAEEIVALLHEAHRALA